MSKIANNVNWNVEEMAYLLDTSIDKVKLVVDTLYFEEVSQSRLDAFVKTYTPNNNWVSPTTPISILKDKRMEAYQVEADPLFFKAQAGEDGVTLEDWQAKRQEIKDRYPYPSV